MERVTPYHSLSHWEEKYKMLTEFFSNSVLHRETTDNKIFTVTGYKKSICELLALRRVHIVHFPNNNFRINHHPLAGFNMMDFKNVEEFEKHLIKNNCIYLPIYANDNILFSTEQAISKVIGFIFSTPDDVKSSMFEKIDKEFLESSLRLIEKNIQNRFFQVNVYDIENAYTESYYDFETLEEAVKFGLNKIGVKE